MILLQRLGLLVILLIVANNQQATAAYDGLQFTFVPLVLPDGHIIVSKVPIAVSENLDASWVHKGFSDPVLIATHEDGEQPMDINLISSGRIRILAQEDGAIVIDCSAYVAPKNVKLDIYDVVQEILICLRLNVPYRTKFMIKIRAPHGDSSLKSLEGPLWRHAIVKKP